jgi:hypothetical protein
MKANYAIFRIDEKHDFCMVQGLKPEQRRLFARGGVGPVDSHAKLNSQGEWLQASQEHVKLPRLIAVDPDIGVVKRHSDAIHKPVTDVWERTALGLSANEELFLGNEELQRTPGVEESGEGFGAGGEILPIYSRLGDAYPDENLVRRRSSPYLAAYD